MSNVYVCVRIRPLIKRELLNGEVPVVESYRDTIQLRESMNQPQDDPSLFQTYRFTFDKVFSERATQKDVYEGAGKPIVDNFLSGYNGCILAYGQTGSGKTHTIMNDRFDGVIPQAIEDIFCYFDGNANIEYSLRASFFQIYNENVYDLLNSTNTSLKIRESAEDRSIYIENLAQYQLSTPQDLNLLIQTGNQNRVQAETKMNTQSSRSHSILTLYLDQKVYPARVASPRSESSTPAPIQQLKSKLMILDLAGSERSHSTDQLRMRETKHINQSLAVLGNVMQQIVQQQKIQGQGQPEAQVHIQFRDSKLTRVLQDSVGGNCKTCLITNVSPSNTCFNETLNSLKFADRAKGIKQHAEVNLVENTDLEAEKYRLEIDRLNQLIQSQINMNQSKQLFGQVQSESEVRELDGQIDALRQQLQYLKSQKDSQMYREFTSLFDEIAKIDSERSEQANVNEKLQNLRQKSLKQRDLLLVLNQRLQVKENAIAKLTEQIKQNYQQIGDIEQILRQHNVQEPEQCSDDSDSEPEDALDQSAHSMLSYDEKIDELKHLEEDFTNKIKEQSK